MTTPANEDAWLQQLESEAPDEQTRVILEAMHKTAESLTPTEETRQAVWRRVEHAMTNHQSATPPTPPWWRSWLTMPAVGFVTASVAALAIGLALWLQPSDKPDFDVIALRGETPRVAIADFAADTPAIVKELQAMAISVRLERSGDTILATTSALPTPLPSGWPAWQQRWGVTAMPGVPLAMTLVSAKAQ